MTATNAVMEGMANTRDSALLSAAAEAVTWTHASQPDENRKRQRVVIFPKELVQLEAFLSTCDPNVDPDDGHPIAYEAIIRESAKYETPPLFVSENSEYVTSDPVLSTNVPIWLAQSRQVATGGRRRVLENGRDVLNSSDEDDEKMVADEEHGMYTPGMDLSTGPIRLSQAEAARQRVAGKMMKEAEAATTRSRAVAVSASPIGLKAAGVPADEPTKGQQVPNYPIVPFSGEGSRAGGFRGVVGSGSNGDTCVAQGNPSPKPGS
jgi:hypothetical protein